MKTSSDDRNPVEVLAAEFLDRRRRGERPSMAEYLERHPALADEIRDLFPALLMMEDLGENSGTTTGSLVADDHQALGIGHKRLGDYRILREIGRGGMGVVYEAEQESLGRRVALKVLSAGLLLDPKHVRRFEREAKAAARLHHTNIVPVFGVGEQDGHHYFVMQFIVGLGLDRVLADLRRLRRPRSAPVPAPVPSQVEILTGADVARSLITGRFVAAGPPIDGSITEPFNDSAPSTANGSPPDLGSAPAILPGSSALSASSDPDRQYYRSIARIGIQVADALEYANRQGILHRDVKPSNLLLDSHGNVWVADFGLAKTAEADDLTHTGDILGTIRYMAPERFSGCCDARSDVYSLGLTLYELVSLRPAYQGSDRHTLIERVMHEDPERLKKLEPGVPRDLETIVAKATSRDPVGRYPTAAALADDLRRFVEDRPIRARRVSSAERFARWCRRNKILASSIGVAAGALISVAVLSLFYAAHHARHAREQLEANERIRGLAGELSDESIALKDERGRLKTALALSNSRLARLHLERGQAAFEKGQDGAGMLWTVESLRMADESGDEAGRHVALANLSAWRPYRIPLKQVFCRGDAVTSVAFSPDGKTILTGSLDKTARLWDVATGRPVGNPMEHSSEVMFVSFRPGGQEIVTASFDRKAWLWDAVTGRPIGPLLPHAGGVRRAAFSADGKAIVTGDSYANARLWDAATGQSLCPPMTHGAGVISLAFSPDGKTILTGGFDKIVRLWDAATGRQIGRPMIHSDGIYSVAFSPDGERVLTASWDKTARLWDAATGQPLSQPMDHADRVNCAVFSPDGKMILTGCSDKTAQLWDAATAQRVGRPLEHQGDVRSVAYSPDGQSILTGSQDGTVRLWAAQVDEPVGRPIDIAGRALAVTLGPDGHDLRVVDRNGECQTWDVASGNPLGQPITLDSSLSDAAFSPDAKTLFTVSSDGRTARLWDAVTCRPLSRPIEYSGNMLSIPFSPDSKMILIGDPETTARLWDTATGRPLGQPLKLAGSLYSAAFSPDGKSIVIATGGDNTVQMWDIATGRQRGEPMPHSGPVFSTAFSPDGKLVLTAGRALEVALWDAATGRALGPALGRSSDVYLAAFSPDGTMIITVSGDRSARLWDTATGQPIGPPLRQSLMRSNELPRIALSRDGRFLVTHGDSVVRLWNTPMSLPGDLARLAAWAQTCSAMEIDQRGSLHALDHSTWLDRRRRLEELGGPPPDFDLPRLDPIHYGPEPTARGDAWKEHGLWVRAEAAYREAIRARPYNTSVWEALARLQIESGHVDKAAATLAAAVRLVPANAEMRSHLGVALLWSGDRAGWGRAISAMLEHFGHTSDAVVARTAAWASVLAPSANTDPELPVRLAETGVNNAPEGRRFNYVDAFAAAQYRAGRFDESIQQFDEAIRIHGGVTLPEDWAFLAMAHHRLGQRDDARRCLEQLKDYVPSVDPAQFWRELEIRLLKSEAEAVILYDPVFPEQPFAN